MVVDAGKSLHRRKDLKWQKCECLNGKNMWAMGVF